MHPAGLCRVPLSLPPRPTGGRPCLSTAQIRFPHMPAISFAPSSPWLTYLFLERVSHAGMQPETPTSTRGMPFSRHHPHGRPACFARGSAIFIDSPNPLSTHASHRFCPFFPMADLGAFLSHQFSAVSNHARKRPKPVAGFSPPRWICHKRHPKRYARIKLPSTRRPLIFCMLR